MRWETMIETVLLTGALGYLGMDVSCDNSETCEMFDWTPIPFKQSVLETAVAVKSGDS